MRQFFSRYGDIDPGACAVGAPQRPGRAPAGSSCGGGIRCSC